jgi:Ca2+-binding EF-hand superfamily protein
LFSTCGSTVPPRRQDFLHDARKARFDEEKARLFAEMLRMRRLYEAFQTAFTTYVQRKRARELVIAFVQQFESTNERIAVDRWLRATMADVAVTTIQRVGRGFVARLYVWWLRKMVGSARVVQSLFRCHMCKKRMRREKRRRVRACTRVQRYWRGRCGRTRARVRLLAKFAREHEENIVARWEWELQQRENAANHIQRYWRGGSDACGRARAARYRVEKVRMDAVRKEMGDNAQDFARRLEVHMYGMEQAWEKLRLGVRRKAREDAKVAKDKLAILRNQRRRVFVSQKEHHDEVTRAADEKEEQRAEVWRRRWRQEMDARGRAERRRVERVLLAPERGSGERAERARVRALVKAKAKEVMLAEEEQGMPCEQVEADLKALELVKLELMEKAKADVQAEWDQEEEAYQAGKSQEQELLDLEAEETASLDREYASKVVARNWFCYSARCRARLACRAQYKKHYDPETRACYYVHNRDGKVAWTKPVILGSEDLLFEEGWLLLTDATFDGEPRHFFYEPKSLRMTWSEPPRGEGIALAEEVEAFVNGEGLLRQKIEIHINMHGQGMRGNELVRHLFYQADLDRSGFLEKPELRKLFDKMLAEAFDPSARQPKRPAHHMSELQLDAAIARMDADGDGQVGMQELMAWMHKLPAAVDEDDRAFLVKLPAAQRHDPHREMRELAREEAELMGIAWIESDDEEEGRGGGGQKKKKNGSELEKAEGSNAKGGGFAAGRTAAKEAREAREAAGTIAPASGGASAGASPADEGAALPEGWQLVDEQQAGGRAYFYNQATGESRWERPTGAAMAAAPAPAPAAAAAAAAAAANGADSYASFAAFDTTSSGYVDARQLPALLGQLGMHPSDGEIGTATAQLDADGDGWIAAADFHAWWANGASMGGGAQAQAPGQWGGQQQW